MDHLGVQPGPPPQDPPTYQHKQQQQQPQPQQEMMDFYYEYELEPEEEDEEDDVHGISHLRDYDDYDYDEEQVEFSPIRTPMTTTALKTVTNDVKDDKDDHDEEEPPYDHDPSLSPPLPSSSSSSSSSSYVSKEIGGGDWNTKACKRSSSTSSGRSTRRIRWTICVLLTVLVGAVSVAIGLTWKKKKMMESHHPFYPDDPGTTTTTTLPPTIPLPGTLLCPVPPWAAHRPLSSNNDDSPKDDSAHHRRIQQSLYYYFYPKLQAMVGPLFETLQQSQSQSPPSKPSSSATVSMDSCFPYTSAQQDALEWMVLEWVVQITSSSTFVTYYGDTYDDGIMDAPDSPPVQPQLQQQGLDQFEKHYKSDQWMHTMVMVLMIQSLQVDMNQVVALVPGDRKGIGAATKSLSQPFEEDEVGDSLVKNLPLSPLNVCGWRGLQCSIDQQQLKSLIWSKLEVAWDSWAPLRDIAEPSSPQTLFHLDDDSLNLQGSIPLELSLLTHLRLLDFSNSPFLVGTLPSPSLLYHLQALYLQQTAMTGLLWTDESSASTDMATVTLIDLRISAQQGLLESSTLNMLRNLKWLDWKKWSSTSVNDGDILPTWTNRTTTSSTIPTEIGYLTGLQGLFLDGNGFTGDLPVEFAKLTSLVTLDLCKSVPLVVRLYTLVVETNFPNRCFVLRTRL